MSLKFVFLLLCGFSVAYGAKLCGVKPKNNLIVGGVEAEENQFPWQVSWRSYNPSANSHRHVCGGSIIADNWILTAAHCVDLNNNVNTIKPENFRAMVGAHSQSNPSSNQQLIEVKRIVVHPKWNYDELVNDVAVVELVKPIGLETSSLNAICLGSPDDAVEEKMAVISGWGLLETGAPAIPDILQWANVMVEKQTTCRSLYTFVKPLSDGEVCAGKNPGGCNGDSGGPLQYVKDGRWYLLGAASWVVRCGDPTYPTVWARVPYFLQFITSTTGISTP